MLEIIIGQPPIIDELRNIFRLPEGTIFTWGSKIYNPSGNAINEPLMKHEEQHSAQQGDNPQAWWQRYLRDIDFRLSQEVPAYQVQYQSAKGFIKDRNKLHTYLMNLAMDLSGPMYGNLLTFQDAYNAIKDDKLFNFDTRIVLK